MADPQATPDILASILLTAPRLAALSAIRQELLALGASPQAVEWVDHRLAQAAGDLTTASPNALAGEAAPKPSPLFYLSPHADLFLAFSALAQSSTPVATALTQAIKAAQLPLPEKGGQMDAATAAAQAQRVERAFETLARNGGPLAQMASERLLGAVRQGAEGRPSPGPGPGQPPPDGATALWLPALFESRMATAPWNAAPRMAQGWAEVLFGLVALHTGLPSGRGRPGSGAGASALTPGKGLFMPDAVARHLKAAIEQMAHAPQRRWQGPVRRILSDLDGALREWETDLAAEIERQDTATRQLLTRLSGRLASLTDLLDAQRTHNFRSLDSGQPLTFWLPFSMDQKQAFARIEYGAENGGRDGRRGSGAYNMVLSLDLTHTGPVQLRCHVRQKRISLEVASADRRLLELAGAMRVGLKESLEERGFSLDRFATTETQVDAAAASPLDASSFHPLSLDV